MSSARPKIWVDTTSYQAAHDRLSAWAEITIAPETVEPGWIDALRSADGVVVLARHRFDAAAFSAAPGLRIVARLGAGYDNVDVPAATAAGVCVTHTPGASAGSVAEHTFALILGWQRKLREADEMVRRGNWGARRTLTAPDLADLTLGIVGLGRIGCRVASIATQGFGMRVLGYDPNLRWETLTERVKEPVSSLGELLSRSDIVTLHVPAMDETQGMIDAKTLAQMRPGALLVNTSRGAVVNQRDLANALEAGAIGGAALDVFEPEPPAVDDRLFRAPGLLLSPHTAGLSTGALRRIGEEAALQVHQVLHNVRPEHLLNPEVWETRRRGGGR